jgi:hypothetical protein
MSVMSAKPRRVHSVRRHGLIRNRNVMHAVTNGAASPDASGRLRMRAVVPAAAGARGIGPVVFRSLVQAFSASRHTLFLPRLAAHTRYLRPPFACELFGAGFSAASAKFFMIHARAGTRPIARARSELADKVRDV